MHDDDRRLGGRGNVFVHLTEQCVKARGAQPQVAPRFVSAERSRGWSLVELVIVLVVAALLIFFAVRTFQPREALALEQAERLRNDLRHVQMLAMTWGQPLRVSAAATSYSVSCVTAGTAPCNAAPVIDPANGEPYLVNLEPGMSFLAPVTLDFDALGRPSSGTTFTLTGASTARTVVVAPITGFATAQ